MESVNEATIGTNVNVDIHNIQEVQQETISHMEIDTRRYEWWNNPVKLIEVIKAIEVEFREDYTKSVTAMKGNLYGLFKLDSDDYEQYKDKSVIIRGIELKFTPRILRERGSHSIYSENKRDGTVITIFDAYERKYRHLSHDLFNAYFDGMDGVEVLRQTQPQKTEGTNVLNNNRFLVVKHDADDNTKVDLGSSIEIQGIRFNIIYEGM